MASSQPRTIDLSPRSRLSRGLLLVFTLLLSFGPANSSTGASQDVDEGTFRGGLAFSLSTVPSQQKVPGRHDVFQIAPGEQLQAELGFRSHYAEAKAFRVILLLNYEQAKIGFRLTPAPLDEQNSSASPVASPIVEPLHHIMEFVAPPEEELWFQIWTAPLAAGYYDLALVFVPDPELTQSELRYSTTFRPSARASVFVGEAALPPTIEYPLLDPEAQSIDSVYGDSLLFGPDPYSGQMYGSQQVSPATDVTLGLNFVPTAENLPDNQLPESPLPTAFVAFIDDRVVPINGQPVLYGSARPGTISWMPITVQAPEEPGTYQVFVQQFPNPYIDPAWAEETGREFIAESSQRFRLEVD